MTLIVCVDARGGMAFNGRRVSRDRVVSERIVSLADGHLRMAPGSEALFAGQLGLCAAKDFLVTAGEKDVCFVETESVVPWLQQADRVILFCWNRTYPYDLRFPMEDLVAPWKLTATEEFKGNSHEKITMEVYEK